MGNIIFHTFKKAHTTQVKKSRMFNNAEEKSTLVSRTFYVVGVINYD